MSLSQAKVDLAVLCKLHEHAEAGGEAITPEDVMRLFNIPISLRRIELALQELHAKQDIEREYHPFYNDEGLWQISRDGMSRVDRALRVPTSFMRRLRLNGDGWLQSDEAKQAVLKKLNPDVQSADNERQVSATSASSTAFATKDINWTKWGTILAGVGIIVTVFIAVMS